MSEAKTGTVVTTQLIRGMVRDASARPAKSASVKLRCGDCIHYKGTPHPSMGKPCSTLSIVASAPAPDCYAANVAVFRTMTPGTIKQIHGLLAAFSPQQHRVFLGLLRNAASLDRKKLKFLQVVYFKTGDGSTLDQFYRGWAFALGPDDTVQIVGQNFLHSGRTACSAVIQRDSLITPKQFKKIKEALIERGALESLPPKVQAAVTRDDYEPPTLDTAQEFLDKHAKRTTLSTKKGKARKAAGGFKIRQRDFEDGEFDALD